MAPFVFEHGDTAASVRMRTGHARLSTQQRVLKQSEHGRGQFGERVDDQRAIGQQCGNAF